MKHHQKVRSIIYKYGSGMYTSISVIDEIVQVFCDKFISREYEHVSGLVSLVEFKEDVKLNIKSWEKGTGFDRKYILKSITKLKSKKHE